jgi:large subunit ribosomal protein L21
LVRGGKENMFAVIATGGKQYTVSVGDVIKVEKLDAKDGKKVNFDVLLISDENGVKVGNPVIENAVCEAQVLASGKADKIVVFKYKPKKNERKKQGHRQPFTQLKILSIKK